MPQWSAADVAILTTALCAIIGAFFAGITTVVKAVREVAAKADVIVGHVNSEKTAAQGRELALRTENQLLREMLDNQKATAALLAQAAATVGARSVRASDNPGAGATLQAIESNTAAIDRNTAP